MSSFVTNKFDKGITIDIIQDWSILGPMRSRGRGDVIVPQKHVSFFSDSLPFGSFCCCSLILQFLKYQRVRLLYMEERYLEHTRNAKSNS